MAIMSNLLQGKPMAQMKTMNPSGQTIRMGDPVSAPDIQYSPNQRVMNQMNTASQVQNYAAAKEMAAQSRTDMRGNVMGYSDTLG